MARQSGVAIGLKSIVDHPVVAADRWNVAFANGAFKAAGIFKAQA
jgi:hypothetical protein